MLRLGDFRLDLGPVVMTMPELLDAPIRAVGGDAGRLVPMTRLDPAYRAVYPDGSELHIRADMGDLREEIRTTVGEADAAGFDRFLDWLERLYATEFDAFVDHNYTSPLDLVRSPATAARLLRLGGLGRSARPSTASSRTTASPDLQLQALYGIAPAKARRCSPSSPTWTSCGGLLPRGRDASPPRGMAQALTDAGVLIHLGVEVREVLRRSDGAVAGIRTADGDRVAADAVVCTVDLPVAYDRLLPGVSAPRACAPVTTRPPRSSGTSAPPLSGAHLRHHNIHFGDDWDGAFEAIIDRGELMPDPSRLVTVPSVSDPTAAPDGSTASTCWNRCRTPVPASTGGARPARCASASTPSSRPAATPPTSGRSCS